MPRKQLDILAILYSVGSELCIALAYIPFSTHKKLYHSTVYEFSNIEWAPCQIYIVFGKVFFCTKRYFPFSCDGLIYSLNNHYSSWLVSKTKQKQNKKHIYIYVLCCSIPGLPIWCYLSICWTTIQSEIRENWAVDLFLLTLKFSFWYLLSLFGKKNLIFHSKVGIWQYPLTFQTMSNVYNFHSSIFTVNEKFAIWWQEYWDIPK